MLHLLPRLFPYMPSTSAANPVIGSTHAREQLSAALSPDIDRQSWEALKSVTSSPALQSSFHAFPRSPEAALDHLYVFCTSSLDAYRGSVVGPEHSVPSVCAMHACCSALMHLSLAVQMLPSAAQLAPGRALTWSEVMAIAQKQQLGSSSLTCWPCIMPLPSAHQPAVAVASFSDSDFTAMQALLNQAYAQSGAQCVDPPYLNLSEQIIAHSLLDLGLLQAWGAVNSVAQASATQQQAAAADVAASAGKPEAAGQLAGLLATLASLLLLWAEMMEYHVRDALQQELAGAGQQEKLEDAKLIMSLGLERQQVQMHYLVHVLHNQHLQSFRHKISSCSNWPAKLPELYS